MTPPLRPGTRLRQRRDNVTGVVQGATIVLDLSHGRYYSLNEVASRVWSLLEVPRRLDEIVSVLLTEREVGPDECCRDVQALASDLLACGVIEVVEGPDVPAPAG
jgi:hypothetical protein